MTREPGVQVALQGADPSQRLRAAMQAGTHPDPEQVALLVERCAVEPDFFVRDTLTWALTRHDRADTVPALLRALESPRPQARSQALHTLSKIGDPQAWPAITERLLLDADDEVARAAWRTASGLVPPDRVAELAEVLATQFGRGGRDVQLSLSRAFVALGQAAEPPVDLAATGPDEAVRVHAAATRHLIDHPDDGFESAVAEAKRITALLGAPILDD